MFKFKDFFESIKDKNSLSKEDLKILFNEISIKTNSPKDSYSGYSIKNSIEVFLGYVSEVVYNKRRAFYFTKGDLNEVLEDMGFKIENSSSGAYDKELFKVLNLDSIYFNRKLIKFLSEVCSNEEVKESSTDILKSLTGHEITLYEIFKRSSPSFEKKHEVLKEIYASLNKNELYKLVSFYDEKLLFSSFTPSDLYESWYINQIYIDEGLIK